MSISKKLKYVIIGAVSAAVLIPLTIRAIETIPLTFKEGDVISANVINTLLHRVNDVQKGYTSSDEIVGTWRCTTYSLDKGCAPGFTSTGGGVLVAKAQNINFSCSSGICMAIADSFYPASCIGGNAPAQLSQPYELNGNVMASGWGIHGIQKVSPSQFVWQINSSLPQSQYIVCEKLNIPPAPANSLTASASGENVLLTWVDQSTDESGFKVQRKTSATGTWTDVTTTAANVVSYTDMGLATGTYWYRILSTNSYGDGMTSSEVQVVVQ